MDTPPQRTTEPGSPPRCEQCSTRARCLFATLAPHGPIQSLIRERTVAVGETVEIQGTHGQRVGVVKLGLLKGLRKCPGGTDKSILLMGKGRLVGFTNPFGQSAVLSLVALTPVRVCEVNAHVVQAIAMQQPVFQQAIYRSIADFLDCMADWSRLLREDGYLTKVYAALHLIAAEEGRPTFRIPSHTELAHVLGARRETVARHIAMLIDQGLLRKVDRWHGVLTLNRSSPPR